MLLNALRGALQKLEEAFCVMKTDQINTINRRIVTITISNVYIASYSDTTKKETGKSPNINLRPPLFN